MSAEDFPYDVFLSHSAKDKAVVRPLAERLRQDGLKVWPVTPKRPRAGGFDEWMLKPGDSIPVKVDPPSLRRSGKTWEGLEPSSFGFRISDLRSPACRPMRSARTGPSCKRTLNSQLSAINQLAPR